MKTQEILFVLLVVLVIFYYMNNKQEKFADAGTDNAIVFMDSQINPKMNKINQITEKSIVEQTLPQIKDALSTIYSYGIQGLVKNFVIPTLESNKKTAKLATANQIQVLINNLKTNFPESGLSGNIPEAYRKIYGYIGMINASNIEVSFINIQNILKEFLTTIYYIIQNCRGSNSLRFYLNVFNTNLESKINNINKNNIATSLLNIKLILNIMYDAIKKCARNGGNESLIYNQ